MERESFLVPDYRRGKVESVVGAWRLRAGPGAREAATHFSHGRDSASHIRVPKRVVEAPPFRGAGSSSRRT